MRVIIVQEHLPHYRVCLYERLRENLATQGIQLDLIYSPKTASNLIPGEIKWANPIRVTKFGFFSWQPIFPLLKNCDLIILQQEVKYLATHLLLIKRIFSRGVKLAFWGHGKNFQATYKNFFPEFLKRYISTKCDWWFAYNDLSQKIVAEMGFPRERITTLYNSIDTSSLAKKYAGVTSKDIDKIRKHLGIYSNNIAIYSGGLYEEKRISFLIEAAIQIQKHIDDFILLICGSGPDAKIVKQAVGIYPFIKYLGPLGDNDRLPYWRISKLLLMPGAVGLVALDSFTFQVPMITTANSTHGPEIGYLTNGENSLIIQDCSSPKTYATATIALLCDEEARQKLVMGCRRSAPLYTIDRTVKLFTDGIMQALESRRI